MVHTVIDASLIDKLLPPFVMGVFAVAFFILWFNRRQFSAALILAGSYAAGMVAFGLEASYGILAFVGPVPFIGDILYSVCSALFAIALVSRFGGRSIAVPAMIIVSMAAVGHGYYRFIDPDLLMRVRIISSSAVILVCLALPVLIGRLRHVSARLLLVQCVMLALALALNTHFGIDPSLDAASEAALRGSLYMSLVNMTVTVVSLTAAVTLYVSYVTVIIKELRMQSETDVLTSLLNRRGFESRAQAMIERQDGQPLVMIVADIDHFKSINDIHGHAAGDKILKHLAGLMRTGVRNSDVCGRIGGEEFCLVMPGARLAIGRSSAEKLRAVFAQTAKVVVGSGKPVTASFGVCEIREGESYQSLFDRADAALYAAKSQGRNRVCTHTVPTAVAAKPALSLA